MWNYAKPWSATELHELEIAVVDKIAIESIARSFMRYAWEVAEEELELPSPAPAPDFEQLPQKRALGKANSSTLLRDPTLSWKAGRTQMEITRTGKVRNRFRGQAGQCGANRLCRFT